MKKAVGMILILLLFSYCGTERVQVERIMEEGVLHVINPETPLRGVVTLDIEKIREIDPYKYDEVGMSLVRSERDVNGEVILYDPQKGEAHRFGPEGEYLGNFIRRGQGPGEFQEFHGTHPRFWKDGILVTSSIKMAWFTKGGEFIKERKLSRHIDVLIDENRYITSRTDWTETSRVERIFLVELTESRMDQEGSTFFEGENVGMFYHNEKRFGFSDSWATPDFNYVYNPVTGRIIGGLNTEYKISVIDLAVRTEAVIEKPYTPVRFTSEQKDELCRRETENEFSRWMRSIYPDTHVAIRGLKLLPNGYLAVYRFSGFREYEIDIFDLEGNYLYALKTSDGVSLDAAQFYDFGFATIETRDDMPVYVEYRITNLPDLFSGK